MSLLDRTIALALLLRCLLPGVTFATHGSWHDDYHDAAGILCCATNRDCVPQPVRIMSQSATHVVVEIGDTQVQIPQQSLHISEDTLDWVCWMHGSPAMGEPARQPRCVFIAPGT